MVRFQIVKIMRFIDPLVEIIIHSEFRSIITRNETANSERRRQIKSPKGCPRVSHTDVAISDSYAYIDTFPFETRGSCWCLRGLSSLLSSEAELERKSLAVRCTLFSRAPTPSLLSYSRVYFANPPGRPHDLAWLVPCSTLRSDGISRPEYKSRCFLSRVHRDF